MCSAQSSSMKQTLMDGDNPLLPEDIIRNILKRLPVKSLIRFQCICKHWKNLIKTPSFIAEHLHHSTHQNPSLFFQGHGLFRPSGWCFLDHDMQVVKAQRATLIGSFSDVMIVDSVNGLLCLQSDDESVFLWNPATREARRVLEAVDISDDRDFHTGFGFSSIINDYKIVRIYVSMVDRVIRSEECLLCTNRVNQVNVYSLSIGSWKQTEFGNLDGISLMSDGLHANGAIVWFGFLLSVEEQDENDGHLVVSFDIVTEVFTLIPLPSLATKSYRNRLTVHENKLAMLSHTTIGNYEFSLIDLWVMEEGTCGSRERWNWTKKYSTSPYPCLLHPGTIWRNEIVCNFICIGATGHEVDKGEANVVLFNITTNESKMFTIPRYGDGDGLFFNYVDSLVSVSNNYIEGS